MTINVGHEKTNELSIQRSNVSDLEMAIADFFHFKNGPNQIVEVTWFRQIIDFTRLVGKGFNSQFGKIGDEFILVL